MPSRRTADALIVLAIIQAAMTGIAFADESYRFTHRQPHVGDQARQSVDLDLTPSVHFFRQAANTI